MIDQFGSNRSHFELTSTQILDNLESYVDQFWISLDQNWINFGTNLV